MKYAYTYVLDTMADWEIGYAIAELNSGRFFQKPGERVPVKTVSVTKDPITSSGGMTVLPDTTLDEIRPETTAVLLLPGADWDQPQHAPIVDKARELLASGANVAAICGATSALARAGLLDSRPHTSNSLDYLKMVAPTYKGEAFYRDEPAVADGNLITASSAGGLLFARYILARLGVCSQETLEAWYHYFNTGDAHYFYALMQTLPASS